MVKIISQNVFGLKDNLKRRQVFMYFREKADIVCFQETHTTKIDEQCFRNEWRGVCFFAHGTNKSGSVFIGFRTSLPVNVQATVSDPEGRFIIVQCSIEEKQFVIVSLYAPNKDSPEFFMSLFNQIEQYRGHRFMIGDFNLTLDPELDRYTTRKTYSNNKISTQLIKTYMEETLLTDIWRDRNQTVSRFTWRQKQGKVASRIDLTLVDIEIAGWIVKTEIVPGFKSDHSAISSEIWVNSNSRGKGLWKLNNRILEEQDYLDSINKIVEKSQLRGKHLNENELWEMTKLEIIDFSQEYSRQHSENCKVVQNQLEQVLKRMYEQYDTLDDSEKNLYQRTETDLEELIAERAKGAMFRSKCRWYNEAEKNTKYFFNLERNKSGAKDMNVLCTQDGTVTTERQVIMTEQHKFYKKLYSSDTEVRFQCQGDNLIKVDNEDKKLMDQPITVEELTQSLKNTKRGCSPGCDGLTTEFYIVFWSKLKQILYNAFIYSYKVGKLFPSALKGIIVTIPKKDRDTRIVRNFRPISLLGTDLKILEKAIAERIKPSLMKIISDSQKGSLPGRRIGANILCVLDIMDHLNRHEEEGIVISVDYYKCFDCLEHQSIWSAMELLNFGTHMVDWAEILYNGCTSRILNQGLKEVANKGPQIVLTIS